MYYVTIVRGNRLGTLVGPFESETDARPWVDPARDAAVRLDPRAWFDGFGVTRLARHFGAGKLNGHVGYTPKAAV